MGDESTEKPGVFFQDESGRPPLPEQTNYAVAERMAIEALARLDPKRQAERCGARILQAGKARTIVELPFFQQPVRVVFPTGEVEACEGQRPVPVWERIILLHYLGGDSPPPERTELIGFLQVPSGGFYFEAFRRRAHLPLAQTFGQDPGRLLAAGRALGAVPEDIGDAAVRVPVLPRVPVVAVVHAADEEFCAEAKILFASTVTSYFCTEDIAVLGGLVAGRLIGQARSL